MLVTKTILRATRSWACGCLLLALPALATDTATAEKAWNLESHGDLDGARSALSADTSPAGLRAFAEFLDRHRDGHSPETATEVRGAYQKWLTAEPDASARELGQRQIAINDLYSKPAAPSTGASASAIVTIPGPLPAFARMAALTPDLAGEELLPALARNIVTNGYEASGNESLQQTEYLRLLVRYMGQARELQALANRDRKIVIPACDSEETGNILRILGYRMRGACGGDIVLETVNPTRAFLTVDSGFPLAQLESELRANHKFELPYGPTSVPVLYTPDYWLQALGRNTTSDFLDAFVSDPSLCRLYLGLSHLDRATAEALRRQAPPQRLKLHAAVLDFYGSMFSVRNGAAAVPGSPKAWASLVGVSPSNGGQFYVRLLETDDGWAASYFDALARLDGPVAAYLTEPEHVRRFYDALRGRITSPGPARPVFRSSTELMLLSTSLTLEGNGQVHVPGGVESWKALFVKHPHGKYDTKLTRAAQNWRSNDDLLEALFALSRKTVENEPLRIFLALNDIDRNRAKPLSPALVSVLIADYRRLGSQYSLFADAPGLSEGSIKTYLDAASDVSEIRESLFRADVGGIFQASTELWRIFVIRDAIARGAQDATFARLLAPFSHVRQPSEAFAAGRSSVELLIAAAGGEPVSGSRQDRMVELLMGKLRPNTSGDESQPGSPAESFARIYDAQRLVSIDTLFGLENSKGTPDAKLLKSLRAQLEREAEGDEARNTLSSDERNSLSSGYWSSKHIDVERKFDLDKALKNTARRELRDALLPFLRDSLVGFVYSYYAPSGAQLLLTNPSFVRVHDFAGPENAPALWRNTEISGSGWPASSGGKLTGSLNALPYAIAEAEQNFLSPRREQALIWADLVPQMIVDVTVTRWSQIHPEQLRWVAAHLRRGRNLMASAALDPAVQARVLEAYGHYATPARVDWLRQHLSPGLLPAAVDTIPPSDLYALASDTALEKVAPDLASDEIAHMAAQSFPTLRPAAIGRAFGSPKPTLTHSYVPGLLHLRTFPALMGYSSRILAETWESNAIYYAALADELGVPAGELDTYVPEWNRNTIENIFATHLEDWPAILRSLHVTGDRVRAQRHGEARAASAGAPVGVSNSGAASASDGRLPSSDRVFE